MSIPESFLSPSAASAKEGGIEVGDSGGAVDCSGDLRCNADSSNEAKSMSFIKFKFRFNVKFGVLR